MTLAACDSSSTRRWAALCRGSDGSGRAPEARGRDGREAAPVRLAERPGRVGLELKECDGTHPSRRRLETLAALAHLTGALESSRVVTAVFHGLGQIVHIDIRVCPRLHGARSAHRLQDCESLQGSQQTQNEDKQAAHAGNSRVCGTIALTLREVTSPRL